MDRVSITGIWRWFLALPNDSAAKTLGMAFVVTLTASVFVSISAVTLQPVLRENLAREQQIQMQHMLQSLVGMSDKLNAENLEELVVRLVDLQQGTFSDQYDPALFNQRVAARDLELSVALPLEADIAGIRRRSNYAPVFFLPANNGPPLIILPVHGAGYQSMIYAFLAIEPTTDTIAGLTIYEQSETPGLGAKILDPDWKSLWRGKKIFDERRNIRIAVVRGQAQGPHEVDGISGATRTGNGVANMIRFWLGDLGFGPFLQNLKSGELEL